MGLPSVSGSVILASLPLNDSAMPDILGGADGGCQERSGLPQIYADGRRAISGNRGIADIARHRKTKSRTGKRKVLQGYSPAG